MTADLATAITLAQRDFRVFPLEPNSKTPAIQGWPKKATTDEATIRAWWTDPVLGWPQGYGVGVATGRGLVVIDLDVKHDGEAALQLLEDVNADLPPTMRVHTPSGGLHLYYRCAKELRNSASRIAPGIDIRGDGGYVVGPGTEIDGNPYQEIL